jgi:hypothetical protein
MRRLLATLGAVAIVSSGCAGQALPASMSPMPTDTVVTPTTPTVTPSIQPATPSPIAAAGPWSATGSMVTGRAEHSATMLTDGKVLVAGGIPDNREQTVLASAELYDPSTGMWTATGSMQTARAQHTATLLPSGKVLVAGGDTYSNGLVKAAAELYDPNTGTWTATGSMTTLRAQHTATLLGNGMVLVIGAEIGDDIQASTELYDPGTGRWTPTGDMITARTQPMATLLRDGTVLVAGGIGPLSPTTHGELTSAELYDPRTGKWTATGTMASARSNDPLTTLADGTVLKTGGAGGGELMLASCELYDPSTGTWKPTGSLAAARGQLTSSLLPDGRVLVAAGFGVPVASAELYDPATGIWSDAGEFGEARFEHTATLLLGGKVLVTGGLLADGVASAAVLYDPAPDP